MKSKTKYNIVTCDGDRFTVSSTHFHETLAEKKHYHCTDRKAHTLYPFSDNADSPFKLVCDDGSERIIDEPVFAAALASGRFYGLTDDDGGTLYPYSDTETTYRIHTEDGVDEFFAKFVFAKLYRRERHARYVSGGYHVLLPLSDKRVASGTSKAENNENQRRSRYNRCETPNGAECRGVCRHCPRNGEAIGLAGRENCCLKDVCGENCSCCPHPRELKAIIPFSHFSRVDELGEGDDRNCDPSDASDFTEELADEEILSAFLSELPGLLSDLASDELALISDLYGLGDREIKSERQIATERDTYNLKINRLHIKLLERFKARLKHLQ
jgi:hypothetical protein